MNADRHEKIHARVATKLGHKAEVGYNKNGELRTKVDYRHDPSPVEVAAIAIAPFLLGAPRNHCKRDRAKFDAEINRLPYRERAQARRDAKALAKKLGR